MDDPMSQEKEDRMLQDESAKRKYLFQRFRFAVNLNARDIHEGSESRRKVLEDIMEALKDPNINMIGVCRKDNDNQIDFLLQKVERRGWRDNLFGMIVEISIGKNPDITRIQEEIAHDIGCSFQRVKQDEKSGCCRFNYFEFDSRNNSKKFATENAQQLFEKIRSVPKILFILRDVRNKLDLEKVGIPFGVDHQGCKLLLISESDDVLSNHVNAQSTFMF